MREAIALYLGGREVSANSALTLPIGSLRPSCPACGELVHLVRRSTGAYFAHWPRRDDSPPCLRRVESTGSGGGGSSTGPPLEERRRESAAFRRALLTAHRLDALDQPAPEIVTLLGRIAVSLQREWARRQRTVPSNAAEVIQATVAANERFRTTTEAEQQVETVLRLWRQLHLPQVEDDLMFLLRLAERLPVRTDGADASRADEEAGAHLLAGQMLRPALVALATVRWARIGAGAGGQRREPEPRVEAEIADRCVSCGAVDPDERSRCAECLREVCTECSTRCNWGSCGARVCADCAWNHQDHHLETGTCPDCGQTPAEADLRIPLRQCWVCREYVCGDCSSACESCGEVLCDDCYHDRWHCAGCFEPFCDNQDESEKNSCEACDEHYCDSCAEDDFYDCPLCGEGICRSCEEECDVCSETMCSACFDNHYHLADQLGD